MGVLVDVDGGVSKHLILVVLRTDAHILLPKRFRMRFDVGVILFQYMSVTKSCIFCSIVEETHKLLRKRDFLKSIIPDI